MTMAKARLGGRLNWVKIKLGKDIQNTKKKDPEGEDVFTARYL